ncbi:glycosyltransferase [Iocasia frigidifontis]|uniref:Glycosyltransferase n=1 Tax=Iocasia fonsfrigidae TaxID=2682810 RepID=A0A8A7KDL5_9FIRM|nr:glycosyltransferase family A protein [Iocasia fonsfrigidae]QTL97688.1 glycosyltransferase [Iocasia fonsfrigidae]
MICQVSIIITTFQRPHLLKWGLFSIARQNIPFNLETIVINDAMQDETENICREYQDKLNLKYIFSGQRNLVGNLKWRVPGFAINIAVKQSSGKILIISCAEMFHLNNAVEKLIPPLLDNSKLIGIPKGWDDMDGSFLNHINNNNGNFDINFLNNYPELNVRLPFLMSISREQYFAIGGYDEDFTGIAYDDNDFVERLQLNGCSYQQTDAKTIHLFHPRHATPKVGNEAWLFNQNLYLTRKGKKVRNENIEWGKL